MTVAQLINMLEQHNLQAKVIFEKSISPNIPFAIMSTSICKCKEKEIYIHVTI